MNSLSKHRARYWVYMSIILTSNLGFTSCNTAKFLGEEEFLLEENKVYFENDKKLENKRTLRYELSTLYEQEENTTLLVWPREWFYLKNQGPGDTTKWHSWQRRVLGEPPTIYDPELSQKTADAMKIYMQFKGYYDAEVSFDEYDIKEKKKKIYVAYYVNARKQYKIDSIEFYSRDPNVHDILQQIKPNSFLKEGEGITLELYNKEKDRITKYMRNNGFAYFYPQYVDALEAIKSEDSSEVKLSLEVFAPFEDSTHQTYQIGDISIFLDYDPTISESEYRDSIVNGFTFKTRSQSFEINPETIINSIYLNEGDLYSESNYEKTNKQLSTLGVFKFVRIRQIVDTTTQTNLINYRIELTPSLNVELGVDFEVSYTNRNNSASTGNLIGIAISPNVQNKNVFGGAELLVSNLTAGVEINPSPRNQAAFWNTIDLGLRSDLYLPKFSDYLKIWKGLNKIFRGGKNKKLVKVDNFYTLLRENANTRISASYNYLHLLDYYRYDLFDASYGYSLRKGNTHRYTINHIGIDYLDPVTDTLFDQILTANPFLERSFGQQLFVSLLFRDFNFVYQSRPNRLGESNYFGLSVEMAGAEMWLGNKIYNEFALTADTLRIGETDFSQYVKLELDYRYTKQFNSEQALASRIAIGVTRPFGFTTDVPYVKQFYVGGANSIRGWATRGLGPGGYLDPLALDASNRPFFYQTGDLKLEFSLEYRFEIFWRLKGAIFLDGGNIWTIKEDPARCGSQFLFGSRPCSNKGSYNDPFYKQIAVSTGLGFRVDLTYFLFRFDLGFRLREPRPFFGFDENGNAKEGDYWIFAQLPTMVPYRYQRWSDFIEPHIGLGFPF